MKPWDGFTITPGCRKFVQYRGVVNLDSVQFMKMGPPASKGHS